MRSALLRGRDHVIVGARGVVAEGDASISISRGGAEKSYEYTDPNEDAAAFAVGMGGTLVAVADGHYGCYGAEHAVQQLIAEWASGWTDGTAPHAGPAAWLASGLDAIVAVNNAVFEHAERRNLPPAPTTFSLMLARPGDDLLLQASAGDSHAFQVGRDGIARDLGWAAAHPRRSHFLGSHLETRENFGDKCSVTCTPLADIRALVLATDGLSERGIGVVDPARTVAACVADAQRVEPDRAALHCAKAVLAEAMASHRQRRSGDNAAVAVVWLGG